MHDVIQLVVAPAFGGFGDSRMEDVDGAGLASMASGRRPQVFEDVVDKVRAGGRHLTEPVLQVEPGGQHRRQLRQQLSHVEAATAAAAAATRGSGLEPAQQIRHEDRVGPALCQIGDFAEILRAML